MTGRFCVFCLIAGSLARSFGAPPVRLAVGADRKSIQLGESTNVRIDLRDAYNQSAAARKNYAIRLDLLLGNTPSGTQTVVIPTGQSSAVTAVKPPRAGIVLLKASYPELREDSIYIQVLARARPRSRIHARFVFPVFQPDGQLLSWLPVQQNPAHRLGLTLTNNISGSKLTANGQDRFRIQAFLTEDSPADLALRFSSDFGNFAPEPLLIPKGSPYGEAFLTSQRPGKVRVSLVNVIPSGVIASVDGNGRDATVTFDPAARLVLVPSPPEVPLGDVAKIRFQLLDLHGDEVKFDEPKQVSFVLEAGLGDFQPDVVTLDPGKSDGSANFVPRKAGQVKISAWTFGATAEKLATLDVKTPIAALLASVVGGILGGLLAGFWRKEDRRGILFRALSGGVVGFVATLACQQGLVPGIPTVTVSNFLWVQLIAIPVGWMGVEFLDVLLRGFGILTTAPVSQPEKSGG
jgi:hypothetical protein